MTIPRNNEPTCGPLYLAALKRYAKTIADERLFAAGFVFGQAEKIYLGACRAAMFRPSDETREWLGPIVGSAAHHYGLCYRMLSTSRGTELWLIETPANFVFADLTGQQENSPAWHHIRGLLCGVPLDQIDECFHERRGSGERCDGIAGNR